jgi:hypothetical protein
VRRERKHSPARGVPGEPETGELPAGDPAADQADRAADVSADRWVEGHSRTGWTGPGARLVGAVGGLSLVVGAIGGFLAGRGVSEPDVSRDGQIAYACALVEQTYESRPTEVDWGQIDEDPAWNAVGAIPGLLWLAFPQRGDVDNEFADLEWFLRAGDGKLSLSSKLAATLERCERR